MAITETSLSKLTLEQQPNIVQSLNTRLILRADRKVIVPFDRLTQNRRDPVPPEIKLLYTYSHVSGDNIRADRKIERYSGKGAQLTPYGLIQGSGWLVPLYRYPVLRPQLIARDKLQMIGRGMEFPDTLGWLLDVVKRERDEYAYLRRLSLGERDEGVQAYAPQHAFEIGTFLHSTGEVTDVKRFSGEDIVKALRIPSEFDLNDITVSQETLNGIDVLYTASDNSKVVTLEVA